MNAIDQNVAESNPHRGFERKTKVLLADDHTIVRDGLRMILDAEQDISVVGEASNGREAVRLVCQLHPDVVIMDIGMAEMNGIEATRRICELCSTKIKVVMLSMYDSTEHIYQAVSAGASGYLLKESAGGEVVKAVRAVRQNRRYFSDRVSDTITDDFVSRRKGVLIPKKSPIERLTDREREILQLVVEGRTSKDIADIVKLSHKTVDSYRSRIMEKLGVAGISELVRFAIEHKLVCVESKG